MKLQKYYKIILSIILIETSIVYTYFSPLSTTKTILTQDMFNTGTLETFSDGSMATAFLSDGEPYAAFFDSSGT